ncbi:hypothetical protein [Actinoplanes siamensis]|nr:hypothetical protein [Actinoplanes siamensis]
MKKRVTLAVAMTGLLLAGCTSGKSAEAQAGPTASASAAPITNGIPALTAAEILKRGSNQVKASKSYHVTGKITNDGSTMEFDFKVAGKDKIGSLTMDGGKMEMLVVGGSQYARMDKSFWTRMLGADLGKKMAAQMKNRWMKTPKGQENKSLAQFFDAVDVDKLLDETAASPGLSKGALSEFNGTPTILLSDADSGTSVYVATTGQPYVLKVGDIGGSNMVFSDFDKEFAEIKEPAAGEVIVVPDTKKKA